MHYSTIKDRKILASTAQLSINPVTGFSQNENAKLLDKKRHQIDF